MRVLTVSFTDSFVILGAVTEDKKEVICTDTTISLPVEGSYVVAELTAVMSPSHFYVILPLGSKSIGEIVNASMSG